MLRPWLCIRLQSACRASRHSPLQEAVEGFKRYCYQDDMESRTDMQGTLALLHVAHFFVAPRLAGLCDLAMSRNFKHASPKDEGASSAELLPMCKNQGSSCFHAGTTLHKPD